MTVRTPLAIGFAAAASLFACRSDDAPSDANNPCIENKGSDDCKGRGKTTVKWDCTSVADRKEAERLGCVPRTPNDDTDRDVCCAPAAAPPINDPAPPVGSATVPCTPKESNDCSGRVGRTKKLDCGSVALRDEAISAGCVSENPGDADEKDVCCPSSFTVR